MDSAVGLAGQQVVYRTPREEMAPVKRKWRNRGPNQRFRKKSKTQPKGQVLTQAGVYDPPRLRDLQRKNHLKTRKYFPRRRKSVPRAPFNNSSFLMRVRRSGGLASLVSPATPAFLTTSSFSPAPQYREGLVEEVKEFGVNGYGSMTGLIHLRSSDEPSSTSTASNEVSNMGNRQPPVTNAQSVQQLEQRLDRDVSRFEMTYPTSDTDNNCQQQMEVRLEEKESHIAYLEDENLTLKERLFLMQQELNELRQRLEGGVSVVVDGQDACSDYGSSD